MEHEKNRTFSTRGSSSKLILDYANVKKALIICQSLEHKLRQRTLSFFEEKEVFSEKEIANKIRLDLDVTKKHLRIMVRAKLLNVFKQDSKTCYSLNEQRLEAIRKFYTDLND